MTCGIKEILRKQNGSSPLNVYTLNIHMEKILKITNISRRKDTMEIKLCRGLQHDELNIINNLKYKGLSIERYKISK